MIVQPENNILVGLFKMKSYLLVTSTKLVSEVGGRFPQ